VLGRAANNTTRKVTGPDVLNPLEELPYASTNNAAQSSLNIIEVLEMCRDQIAANGLE
jgi:hypothetical protein